MDEGGHVILGSGERFKYRSMTERYRFRPPYPEEVTETLLGLLPDAPRVVLDAGCGPGKLARQLAPHVDRVDAVDFSTEMLCEGRAAPGGDHPGIRWIHAPIESAPLDPPYGLAVAGASFHWFDQSRVLERLARALAPDGLLAVLDGDAAWHPPWEDEEREILMRTLERMTGVPPVWRSGDVATRPLVDHPGFERVDVRVTEPVLFEQSVDEYLACQHSRQSFCLEAMGETAASEFGAAVRALLARYAWNGRLHYPVRTRIEWGRARAPSG